MLISPSAPYYFRASYLYILRLDRLGIAWEFQRRAIAYSKLRDESRDSPTSGPAIGVESSLLDPLVDAREIDLPAYGESVSVLELALRVSDSTTGCNIIWKLPGYKRIAHVGSYLFLTGTALGYIFRIRIRSEERADAPCGYWVDADRAILARLQSVRRLEKVILARKSVTGTAFKPGQRQLFYMRVLIALDAHLGGLSYRAIAVLLFGDVRTYLGWGADENLKAQVRHFVQEGVRLMSGGYLRLIE